MGGRAEVKERRAGEGGVEGHEGRGRREVRVSGEEGTGGEKKSEETQRGGGEEGQWQVVAMERERERGR